MKRVSVAFFALLALPVLAGPPAAGAQTGRTPRVAYVSVASDADTMSYYQTFHTAMRELGYVERTNLILDARFGDGDVRGLPALVDEVIALKPDVLVGWEQVAQVMRMKTTSIPIVLPGAIDPIAAGLARSLARPGLNVTGSVQLNDQLPAKHIEIIREILPRLGRVGQLVDTTVSGCRLVEQNSRQAARSVGAVLVPYYVTNRSEIESAFLQMEKERPDVLLPCPTYVLLNFRDLLIENVLRLRIPFTSFIVANVPQGVLFSYAASIHEGHRKAAAYVDKIIKGAKPGDLPIEQPTRFDMVINLKTARLLGLTIPPSVLLRADKVIQ
jgi:putative ABC transport system substrate-binding protein